MKLHPLCKFYSINRAGCEQPPHMVTRNNGVEGFKAARPSSGVDLM
jgi:hypothetical protein